MVRRSFARAFASSPLIFPPNKPPATQATAAGKTSLIKWKYNHGCKEREVFSYDRSGSIVPSNVILPIFLGKIM